MSCNAMLDRHETTEFMSIQAFPTSYSTSLIHNVTVTASVKYDHCGDLMKSTAQGFDIPFFAFGGTCEEVEIVEYSLHFHAEPPPLAQIVVKGCAARLSDCSRPPHVPAWL